MSGLDLYLKEAIDIEKTHQLAFYILLKSSDFGKYLFSMESGSEPKWESEKRLFDLSWDNNHQRINLEFKVLSELTENQIERQTGYLLNLNNKGYYILLGPAWFEYTEEEIRMKSQGYSKKIGYYEIIDALNKLLEYSHNCTEILELAKSYKSALSNHLEKFLNGYRTHLTEKNEIYYFSLLYKLQQEIKNIPTSIYRVSHPGGLVFILNDRNSEQLNINGEKIEIYSEIVNETLCIKLNTNSDNIIYKTFLRGLLREILHARFDSRFNLLDKGRIGGTMTICQVQHDFSDLTQISKSVEIFREIHENLQNVKIELEKKLSQVID